MIKCNGKFCTKSDIETLKEAAICRRFLDKKISIGKELAFIIAQAAGVLYVVASYQPTTNEGAA